MILENDILKEKITQLYNKPEITLGYAEGVRSDAEQVSGNKPHESGL